MCGSVLDWGFASPRPRRSGGTFWGAAQRAPREFLERSLRADILVDINIPPDLWPVQTDPAQLELALGSVQADEAIALEPSPAVEEKKPVQPRKGGGRRPVRAGWPRDTRSERPSRNAD